jgi:hypothetical protein
MSAMEKCALPDRQNSCQNQVRRQIAARRCGNAYRLCMVARSRALNIRMSKTICLGLIGRFRLALRLRFMNLSLASAWATALPEEIIECHSALAII